MSGKNIAVTTNNYLSHQNPHFVDHCGRPIRYDSRVPGIENGILASALFLAVAAGATIVKADEGRRDARCGWGPQRAARAKWGSMASIRLTNINIRTLGLKRSPAKPTTWHLRRVIMPRRSITGRLVRGQVWRRHDGRRWLYKKFVA
jgi:hypothetical protein